MRKIGRYKRKKQKKWLIIGSFSLLLFLCVGYAAFSTNLSITAKGNIIETINVDDLKKMVTNSGDGLYLDLNNNDRYVYRGNSPHNYINVNGEIWRILAIESDDTLKIIKQESIGSLQFDYPYSRPSSTFCVQSSYGNYGQNVDSKYGCNVWNKKEGEYTSGSLLGTVDKDASLNTYLNTTFYNSLNDILKDKIVEHIFYVGPISSNDIQIIENDEKAEEWIGKVALLNYSDYMKASLIDDCLINSNCLNDNYIYNDIISIIDATSFWTLASQKGSSLILRDLYNGKANTSFARNDYATNPVVYLNKSVSFTGDGTEDNPFIIH